MTTRYYSNGCYSHIYSQFINCIFRIILVLQIVVYVTSQPTPINDECINAIHLTTSDTKVQSGTTIGAASDTTSDCNSNYVKQAPEVFYTVTGNGRRMTATTCTGRTMFPTGITLWYSLCAGCDRGSISDGTCQNGARVTWDSIVDNNYTLFVYGRGGVDNVGAFGLIVSDYINPPNDKCDNAIPLFPNDPETIIGSTINATTDTASSCNSTISKQSPEVFYTVVGNGRRMTATTCSDRTTFPTALTIWYSQCAGCLMGSLSDGNCLNGARITWDSIEGNVYTLLVYGSQPDTEGDFEISLNDFENPENDYCERAIRLSSDGSVTTGTTVNATESASRCGLLSPEGVTSTSPDVFYSVIGTGTNLTVSTCSDFTNFNTSLVVYRGECTTCIDTNAVFDECSNNYGASVTWKTENEALYTIAVLGRHDKTDEGVFGIRIYDPNSQIAPSIIAPFTAPRSVPVVPPRSTPIAIPTKTQMMLTPTKSPITERPTLEPTGAPVLKRPRNPPLQPPTRNPLSSKRPTTTVPKTPIPITRRPISDRPTTIAPMSKRPTLPPVSIPTKRPILVPVPVPVPVIVPLTQSPPVPIIIIVPTPPAGLDIVEYCRDNPDIPIPKFPNECNIDCPKATSLLHLFPHCVQFCDPTNLEQNVLGCVPICGRGGGGSSSISSSSSSSSSTNDVILTAIVPGGCRERCCPKNIFDNGDDDDDDSTSSPTSTPMEDIIVTPTDAPVLRGDGDSDDSGDICSNVETRRRYYFYCMFRWIPVGWNDRRNRNHNHHSNR